MGIDYRFYERNRADFLDFGSGFSVELAGGASGLDAFVKAVQARTPAGAPPPEVGPPQDLVRRVSLTTPVDLETNALLVLGISLAVAAAIALGLMLRAEQRIVDVNTPALRTLGLGPVHIGAIAVLRMLPVVIGGAAIAVLVAVALSGRYPIGIGRQLELDGGLDVNVAVLILGGLAIGLVTAALSFVAGIPRRDRRRPPTHRLTLARWLGRSGAPTDLVLGTQFAFERGRGMRSVPSRAAVVVGAGALTVVAAVAVFVAGVDRLYSEPAAHGWRWDAAIGNTNFPMAETTTESLARDRRVRRQTRATYGDAFVDGRPTEFLVFDPRGGAPPDILAGRLPQTSTEVALGSAVLDDLGVEVGDVVRFSVAGTELAGSDRAPTRRMRVVGEALPPVFGEADIGDAGLVTFAGLEAAGGDVTPNYVLVNLRDDDAGLAAIRRDYTEEMVTDTVPARIVNLHRVRRLPVLGLVVAGLLGTVVLAYTLAITARARSNELAVLRSLGLASRRVRAVLAWQGTVLGFGVLVIGLPLGLLLGVAVWNRVADGLGVDAGAIVSPWLLLLVPLALLVAVGASILPARRARRLPVAELVRVE
jgi:putative ABC transport system permease protein